jgi:heme oxygenase
MAELADKAYTDIPVCYKLPQVETPASSLGALYVTEGSTLGGQIITKMIAKQLGIGDKAGFSFFNAYGADTHYRWQNFKSIINRSRNEQEENEMIDTAIATFSTFNDWLSDYERN